ncbi:MAG: phytanoyl-CoA dioxygenase family protein [Acidobacteriota bacterium]
MSILDVLRPQRPEGPLNRDGQLWSKLWLDQRNALKRIKKKLRRGEIDEPRAQQLRQYAELGYLKLSLDLDAAVTDQLNEDVERLWRERPGNVSYAYHSLLTPFTRADPEHRKPSCRIADLHSASETALGLYLHREIFSVIDEIFGEPSVATQSLYFEWGSQQGLHRDPVYVQMNPASHLAAAWIALEDIGPDCGPLVYVPGSHRLPYYLYQPDRYTFDHLADGQEQLEAAQAWDQQHTSSAGLELETFTCKRGEVLIWHHSLLHGGSYPTDPALTRKSFVIHFTTLASMPKVQNSYLTSDDGSPAIYESEQLLVRDGCHGFDSPLAVHCRQPASEETSP